MKKRNSIWMVFLIAIAFSFALGEQTVHAESPSYTIDQVQQTPPSFDDYQTIPVNSVSDLTNTTTGLPADNDKVIYQLQTNIQMTSQIKIINNKAIDLNGHSIAATSNGSLLIEQANTTTKQFKIYNGDITGGPEKADQGGNWSQKNTDMAFLNIPVSTSRRQDTVRDIVIQDLTYKSSDKGGSFVIGLSSNVYSLGTVDVSTYNTNLRAGNMIFLGDFTGNAFGDGEQDWYGQGAGGLNLSFDGMEFSYMNSHSDAYGSGTMNQNSGDRRLYVGKAAHVNLTNTNSSSTDRGKAAYANNIANYAVINVEGSLICKSQGTSLQSTASWYGVGNGYKSQAGTFNGRTNIYVNPGATFEVSTLGTYNNKYGLSYSFYQDFYVNAPKSFDLTFLGSGPLIYSYGGKKSNMYLYNQNIALWTRADSPDGTGNPTSTFNNVEWMQDTGIIDNSPGTVTSSDSDLAKNFSINSYSRISSGVNLPNIIAPETINNGDTSFSGSSNYVSQDGTIIADKVAAGSTVTLTIDGQSYTTTVDTQGKWSFSGLDLATVAGGTVGTINLTDTAGIRANTKEITVVDTLPPKVTTKVIKVKENTTDGLDNPKDGIASANDETTATEDLTYEYATSSDDREEMLKKPGVYSVQIKVGDAAGNITTVSTPVIIYHGEEIPSDGFVEGNDFSIDFNTWKNASSEEKRNIIVDTGKVKGYAVTDSAVTDVTTDSSKMLVTVPDENWEASQTYDVKVTVGTYTKIIKVFLTPSDVNMTIKQVYSGTDDPIYSDLINKTTVDNSKTIEVQIGDNIEEVITNLEKSKEFTLNYNGYDAQTVSNYKIYENGVEITPTPTTVPDSDFTLSYGYTGQLKFDQVATNLDFGTVKISGDTSDTSLTETSDQKISVINTLQNNKWTLKAAVPNGIKSTTNKMFLGSLIYKSSESNEQIIGSSATQIKTQDDNNLYSQLNLKDNENGLFLQQSAGNLKGNYTGIVVWTLEDSP